MSEPGRVDLAGTRGMFGYSLTGKRESDQDFVACGEFGGVRAGVICDGMGGVRSGEKASKIAASIFVRRIGALSKKGRRFWLSEKKRHTAYRNLIEDCHQSVSDMAGGAGLSGTTLTAVVAVFRKGSLSSIDLVHMGDCRCYFLSDGGARLMTEDHSVTGDMVRAGYIDVHEIEETSGKNTLTKHIGDEAGSEADVSSLDVDGGSRFLLCCDGVWGPLHKSDGIWLPDGDVASQSAVEEIVQEAIERGSTDNCSALVVDLGA